MSEEQAKTVIEDWIKGKGVIGEIVLVANGMKKDQLHDYYYSFDYQGCAFRVYFDRTVYDLHGYFSANLY